jgi:hypothetical protein
MFMGEVYPHPQNNNSLLFVCHCYFYDNKDMGAGVPLFPYRIPIPQLQVY